MDEVVGVIGFDLSGVHYLNTFDGRFVISDGTIELAYDTMKNQSRVPPETSIAGLLARGRVDNGQVFDISYLIHGAEYPRRLAPKPE